MNKTNAQLRRSAKQNLLGHYGTAIAALIVTELVTLILNIPFNRMTQQGIAFGSSSRMVLGIAGTLIVSLVAVLFQAGISHIHLQFARGIDTRVSEVFFAFKNRPDRYLGYGILNILLAVACVIPGSLCCIIPILNGSYTMAAIVLVILGCILLLLGCIVLIVVLLSWSMTVFILLEDNSITVLDAIRRSRQMMKGKKGRFFLLGLSFIGWILLSVLSFFIGLLWVIPYFAQSQTCFYLELTGRGEEQAEGSRWNNPQF